MRCPALRNGVKTTARPRGPRGEEPAAGLSACRCCGAGVRRKEPWCLSARSLAEDAEDLGWAWVWSGRGKKNCRMGGNLTWELAGPAAAEQS